MSIAQQLAPHLPYLRRYARALTGARASGDAYVVSVLEALLEDSTFFDRDLPSRVALYKVFDRIWRSVSVNHEPAVAAASKAGNTRRGSLIRTSGGRVYCTARARL